MQENPYLSPVTNSVPVYCSKLLHWGSYGVAGVFAFLSLPVGWWTLKLANQVYLHIWPISDTYYGFEINGVPISNEEFVAYGAITVFVLWLLAGSLIATSRFLSSRHDGKSGRDALGRK